MIDWIIEVLQALSEKNEITPVFFRTFLVLDLYCKYSEKNLQDSDIHLIGLTAMYISSKYEDIYPISINDFCEKAGHSTFSPEEIREQEFEILRTFGFSLNFSTLMDIVDFYLKFIFEYCKNSHYYPLREIILCFLIICIYDDSFNNIEANILVLACISKGIEHYYYVLVKKGYEKLKSKKEEKKFIKLIFEKVNFCKIVLKSVRKKIDKFFDHFMQSREFEQSLKLYYEIRNNIEI
jgi:hypothetical protein